jgi:hypothetical protein
MFFDKWHGLSRHTKNFWFVLILDLVLFAGAFLQLPIFTSIWRVLTRSLPDIYDVVFRQLIAFTLGVSPDSVAVSGTVLSLLSPLCSVLTVHLPVAYLVGRLFDSSKASFDYSFLDYTVLLFVLFCVHVLFLVLAYVLW